VLLPLFELSSRGGLKPDEGSAFRHRGRIYLGAKSQVSD
jgi:hypothetical protein